MHGLIIVRRGQTCWEFVGGSMAGGKSEVQLCTDWLLRGVVRCFGSLLGVVWQVERVKCRCNWSFGCSSTHCGVGIQKFWILQEKNE